MVLDELTDEDFKYDNGEYIFIIEKELYDRYRRFSIDYEPEGLRRGFDIKGYGE